MKKVILTMSVVAVIAALTGCKCKSPETLAVQQVSPDVQKVEVIDSTIVYTHIFDGVVDIKTYTYNGDVCVEAERVYVFPDQLSALRHYRRAVEQAELYDNIEMFNNQVKYELKEAQHKLETEGLTINQLKKKFDNQISECKADLKKKNKDKK